MSVSEFFHLILHFDQHLEHISTHYGFLVYLILFLIVLSEIGILPLFFLPGDPLLFICGAYCETGIISLWLVIPVIFIAATLGSLLNYAVGRKIGQQVFEKHYRWLDKDALNKTHAFYERHGGITFLLSPFIAVVRTFAPFVAGVSQMTFKRFVFFSTSGVAIWAFSLVVAGYFFGNIPLIRHHLSTIVLLGIGLGVGSLLVSSAWKALKAKTPVA